MRYSIISTFVGYHKTYNKDSINKHPSKSLDFSVHYKLTNEGENSVEFNGHLLSNITDSKGKIVFEVEVISFCKADKSVARTEEDCIEFKQAFILEANKVFGMHFAKDKHLMEHVISSDMNFAPPAY